jgi:hypothetical protein
MRIVLQFAVEHATTPHLDVATEEPKRRRRRVATIPHWNRLFEIRAADAYIKLPEEHLSRLYITDARYQIRRHPKRGVYGFATYAFDVRSNMSLNEKTKDLPLLMSRRWRHIVASHARHKVHQSDMLMYYCTDEEQLPPFVAALPVTYEEDTLRSLHLFAEHTRV